MSQEKVMVKAYYNDLNENQPEIRRFALDISPTTDVYRTLAKTISQFNINYPPGRFTLQYIDEDNDRITFSSNNELQSAVKNISVGGIIKIFVKPKSNQDTTIHMGVICDGCQGSVVGNRYKCMQCFNYDLCQIRSDKNLHSEHNMLKLTRTFQHRRRRGPHFRSHFMPQQCKPSGLHFPRDITDLFNQFKSGEQANKPVDGRILLENIGKVLHEKLKESKSDEKKEEVTTTESKPAILPLNNLFEQFQTMFQSSTVSATAAMEEKKKIDEFFERLTWMGFGNSKGALTELIKSKKR